MEKIKISVIIAIYNVQQYLVKCLDSVINQTYKNLEIICVDDGSTDESGIICDDFAEKDTRITVIHKENGGECSARNVGIEICTGDYISFIDGDDWLELDMYKVLADGVFKSNADISICGYFKDYEDRSEIIKNELPVSELPMDTENFLKYIYIRDKYRGVASYLWNRIINRKIFDTLKLRFSEDMVVCHDQIIAAECYMNSKIVIYNSKPLYHYVQRKGSALHDAKRRLKNLDACKAYEYIIDLFYENKVDEYIIDYVKRFYVYHSMCLLKLAYEIDDKNKISILKSNINKYLDIYCRTNDEHPERIQEVKNLLKL